MLDEGNAFRNVFLGFPREHWTRTSSLAAVDFLTLKLVVGAGLILV